MSVCATVMEVAAVSAPEGMVKVNPAMLTVPPVESMDFVALVLPASEDVMGVPVSADGSEPVSGVGALDDPPQAQVSSAAARTAKNNVDRRIGSLPMMQAVCG